MSEKKKNKEEGEVVEMDKEENELKEKKKM